MAKRERKTGLFDDSSRETFDALAAGAEASTNRSESREDSHTAKKEPQTDYHKHFAAKHETVPIATRVSRSEREALESYAIQQDRRLSDILRDWIHDRMNSEGIS
jgi:flagellar biosynthesis/type III secretory pathway M-ring protein FliF/YscJ